MSGLPSRKHMLDKEATLTSWGKVLWDLSISDHVSIDEAGGLDEIRHFLVLLDHEYGTYDLDLHRASFRSDAAIGGSDEK